MKLKKIFNDNLPAITLVTLPFLLLSLGYTVYSGYSYMQEQEIRYQELETKFQEQLQLQAQASASASAALAESLKIIEKNLSLTKSESLALANALSETLSKEQQKINSLQEETEKIGGTVGTLEKLSQTDPELLQKYSKVFFLNENYVPARLSEIKNQYLYSEKKTQYLHSDVLPFLANMLDDALKQNVAIYIKSAYRSFNEQDILKNEYSIIYGQGTANQFSADQGYSEHQLGTTVDFITTGLGGQIAGFGNTQAYTWLTQNAYKYGFVLSYPKNNEYYIYEPWHWRFVGRALAQKLHNEDKHFYELSQRELDDYLVSIFD